MDNRKPSGDGNKQWILFSFHNLIMNVKEYVKPYFTTLQGFPKRPRLMTVARWSVVGVYMIAIAFLSLSPARTVSSFTLPIQHFDKLAHAGMHGVLAFLICWALRYRFRQRLWLLYVVVISHIYGFLMEAGQYYMPYGRTFSWGDIAANTAGAMIAVGMLGFRQVWKAKKTTEDEVEGENEYSDNIPQIGKRIFDLVVALLGLLLLSPLFLLIALSVRVRHGSPVLFRQLRPGLHGKPFIILKFRTMTEKYDRKGELLPDDQRLTALGRWLRSTSLDELPELINVIKGEMSLVGPRPLLMRYLDRYTPRQMRRHQMPPGITGWAQVKGRNAISWEEKFKLDIWYVDHQNFSLDLKILLLTLRQVFSRQGINADDLVTMPEFTGTRKNEPTNTGTKAH